MTGLTRTVPISLFLRDDLPWLRAFTPQTESADTSGPATEVCEFECVSPEIAVQIEQQFRGTG